MDDYKIYIKRVNDKNPSQGYHNLINLIKSNVIANQGPVEYNKTCFNCLNFSFTVTIS